MICRCPQCEATDTPDVMEWQDISTAPKDGTPILVAWRGGVYRVSWKEGVDASDHNWEPREGWFVYEAEDGFYSCSFLDDAQQPTHWMPLPNPPKENE